MVLIKGVKDIHLLYAGVGIIAIYAFLQTNIGKDAIRPIIQKIAGFEEDTTVYTPE